MLEKYIKHLLYTHDCVIVPEFGGFISQYVAADIHPVTHKFCPPSKTVAFNKQLNVGDGLLVAYISRSQKSSWEESNAIVKEAVFNLKNQLNTFGVVVLEDVGRLYTNASQQIEFEPQASVNFLEDSFGLTELFSKPVERNFSDNSKSPLKMSKPENKKMPANSKPVADNSQLSDDKFLVDVDGEVNHKAIPWLGILSVVLLFVCMGFLLYLNHNGRSLASVLPVRMKSSQTSEPLIQKPIAIVANADEEPNLPATDQLSSERPNEPDAFTTQSKAFASPLITTSKSVSSSNVARPKDVNNTLSSERFITLKTGLYYIIIGSFSEKKNALKLHKSITRKGKGAMILAPGSGNNNFFKVAVSSYPTLKLAADELDSHKADYDGAWVLAF